jgi:glucose-1-phosphate cytidylyltransferase
MKAVILAGGLGTRLSEETASRPKPMVEVGGRPILWHIMKMYSQHGVNDFIICCGYKGYVIKEYFANYFLHMSDVTFDMRSNTMQVHNRRAESWSVTLIDTGDASMTGGRLGRVAPYLREESDFCFTYGDGVTVPPGRFGALEIANQRVANFKEKPKGDGALINGGFFVLNPSVLSLIDGDHCVWEQGPLNTLASTGELMAFEHQGFWQPMDTLRDKQYLEDLWASGKAPWKSWD